MLKRAHARPPLLRSPQLKRNTEQAEPAGTALPLLRRCAPLLFSDAGKQRFFQLSADLTTLRWAWNKYVLLFYVEAVHSCDEELSLRLVLTMEADLVLGFKVRCRAAAARGAAWGAAWGAAGDGCLAAWPPELLPGWPGG